MKKIKTLRHIPGMQQKCFCVYLKIKSRIFQNRNMKSLLLNAVLLFVITANMQAQSAQKVSILFDGKTFLMAGKEILLIPGVLSTRP